MVQFDIGGIGGVISLIGFFACLFFLIWKFFYPLLKQFYNSKRIYELEDGFSFKAGGTFDEITLSFPFVFIVLEPSSLSITHSDYCFKIMYNQIKSVKLHWSIISGGVEITHTNETCGSFIIWTSYRNQLLEYIQKKIYEMSTNSGAGK
jgi:hypothetical protein